MTETLILVDNDDNEIGQEEKMQTHREGETSPGIFDPGLQSRGEILLQKRSVQKYHSGGFMDKYLLRVIHGQEKSSSLRPTGG